MKVSEQIAIIKAYENGKTIEWKHYGKTEWKSIEHVENYLFDFVSNEYRIKSEDKYRPYEGVDEAFADAKKHGFWMKHKPSGLIYFSTRFLKRRNTIYINNQSSVIVLDNFVWFDDNSPCGVKIE